MFGQQHEVRVRELMSTEVERLPADATVETAVEWFDSRGYTTAPVADSSPTAAVTAEAVRNAAAEAPDAAVTTVAEPVTLQQLLSPELEFEGLLDRLREAPRYFVGWEGEVVGVLSRADLNRPPAHVHLYTLLYELEALLRDVVAERTDWEVILRNVQDGDADYDTEYEKVRSEYERHADADLHLRPVDYTTFWQLERVVAEHDELWKLFPYHSRDRVVRKLGELRELRNEVAHYGNVVQSMDADLLAEGRDIIGLQESYSAIVDSIEALREPGKPSTLD